jgi:rhodanese-related sulfurtransferase
MRKLELIVLITGSLLAALTAFMGSCTIITGETQKLTSSPVSLTTTTTTSAVIINKSPSDIMTWMTASSFPFHIIDVRTPEEYASGHLINAINIDYNSPDFGKIIDKLDKTAYYIVYCRTGARSASASQIMLHQGFIHIINMTGGITEWINEGFTITK